MKKVGMLSFHRAINYGAVLQVYALFRYLCDAGCKPEIIDYRCEKIESLQQHNSLKQWLRYFLLNRKTRRKFEHFRREFLKQSKPYKNTSELAEADRDYDTFICGSDQVWNYWCNGFDNTYFLDFVTDIDKKNAYAASFGFAQMPEEHRDHYHQMLADFGNISVREKSAGEIINGLLGCEVPVVIDPVLLLERSVWSGLARRVKHPREYILLYTFELTPTIKNYAEELSRQSGLPLLYIANSINRKINAIHMRNIGPQEFLTLFMTASHIITNSFHGTAFAIEFNREFSVELRHGPAINTRLTSILELFGLSDRLIVDGDLPAPDQDIDFEAVNKILAAEREKAGAFIDAIIR